MYDREGWKNTELYRSNETLLPAYKDVCEGLDGLLSSYGYTRHHNYYLTDPTKKDDGTDSEDTIVIFCHLGVTCMMLSHLLGISPVLLLHGFYLAPTSVTVVASEERMENNAIFRVQVMGDVTHLLTGGEQISHAGYFTEPFQG